MGTNDAGRTVLDAVCAVPRFLGQAVLMMCRRRLLGRVVDCFPSYTYAWGQPVRGLAPAKRASSPPASNARGWLGAPAERDLTTVTADLQPWLLPPHFITAHHPCRNTTTPPPRPLSFALAGSHKNPGPPRTIAARPRSRPPFPQSPHPSRSRCASPHSSRSRPHANGRLALRYHCYSPVARRSPVRHGFDACRAGARSHSPSAAPWNPLRRLGTLLAAAPLKPCRRTAL